MIAEEPVLRVYQKVNPSAFDIESPEKWVKFSTQICRRFFHDYKLPFRLFKGASVLDVGCGTGEKSLVMASLGARVTGVDYNEGALKRARHLASLSSVPENLVFHNSTLPELPSEVLDRKFDFVHADGILHHTIDPERTLNIIAERVAEGGWLIVRNYQTITSLQRLFKRLLVRLGTGEDEDHIVANTERLFPEETARSVQRGGRTVEQSLYDNFVNPRYNPFDSRIPFDLCKRYGFVIYALTPGIEAPVLIGPDMPFPTDRDFSKRMDSLTQAWWSAGLARSAMASAPASRILETKRPLLEECLKAGSDFEGALSELIKKPDGERWDLATGNMIIYLESLKVVFEALSSSYVEHVTTFLEEIRGLQPVVRECFDDGDSLESLPAMKVLFRGLSGFPMTSWVLWRPEPIVTPLTSEAP